MCKKTSNLVEDGFPEERTIILEHCGCPRTLTIRCVKGVKANLDLMGKLYEKDWNMRLYHDLEDKDPLMADACSLACNNSNLDLCRVKNLPHPLISNATTMFPMNWRFFPKEADDLGPPVLDE